MEAKNEYSERFIEVIDSLGIDNSIIRDFGISQSLESKLRNGVQSVSLKVILKALESFPSVNANYILTGRGSMFLDEERQDVLIKTLPRIPYDAAAGILTDMVEGVTEYGCERIPVISAFPKYDFTIRVTGRSMEPYYFSGDEVACLRINESQFIQWGRVHVLDTTQGVVIKRIYENGDSIRCASFNPEYPDFNVPKEDIRSYNLVVGALRL